MSYKLIMLEKPILISDEETSSGGWMFDKEQKFIHNPSRNNVTDFDIRIIAGLPELPKTGLSIVADEIGWVDVEKLAIESIKKGWGQLFMRDDKGNPYGKFIGERPYPTKFWHDIDKWVEGFKAAQSLNEKKYTLSELELAVDMAREGIRVTRISEWETEKEFEYSSEQIIRHLSKPKEYNVEVEMEDVGGYRQDSMSGCWISKWQPKLTNNTITITKIIKQL